MGRVQWRNSGKEEVNKLADTLSTENDENFMDCENKVDNQYYSYLINSPETKKKLHGLKRLAVIDLSTSKSTGKINMGHRQPACKRHGTMFAPSTNSTADLRSHVTLKMRRSELPSFDTSQLVANRGLAAARGST